MRPTIRQWWHARQGHTITAAARRPILSTPFVWCEDLCSCGHEWAYWQDSSR